ncbi:MAG: glycosyltransferase [Actinomycetota bacterium]|nr:glycosyltransferase [Actinomycetota bacterium]
MKLSVLMPVYNEARTLRTIVRRVLDAPVDYGLELVAVDDGSTDRSLEVLQELAASDDRIVVLSHRVNRGKGAAIRTAIARMTGDIGVVQDSDLEYDPAEFPRLLKPIMEDRADAVFGSRFAASPERRVLFYWHSLGIRVLTWFTNILNDLNLTDMETGYKAVRADILKGLRLRSERFGVEPELTTRLAQWGARIYEVPISYHGRTYAEGKNIGWRDGVQALWLLFKFRFLDTRFTEDQGRAVLESLGTSPQISRWMVGQFDGVLGDRVLEAGSGNGNLTPLLLDRERVVALDIDASYVRRLDHRYGHLENFSVIEADLEDPDLFVKLENEGFDTVLCVNVLEHLDRPDVAVQGFHRILQPGGRALILVPAHGSLYSAMDKAIEHRQRYEGPDLRQLLEDAGFEVERLSQFNRLGVVGWSVNRWTGRTSISHLQVFAFRLMLPLARVLERARKLRGLSWIAVARKKA